MRAKGKLCIGIILSLVIVLVNTIISLTHWIFRVWVQFPVMVACWFVEWMFSRMTLGIVVAQMNLYWIQLKLHKWAGMKTIDIEFIIEDIQHYMKHS